MTLTARSSRVSSNRCLNALVASSWLSPFSSFERRAWRYDAHMPDRLVSALASISWQAIVKQAPALLAAAEVLMAKSRRPVAPTAATDVEALRQRIAELEMHQQAYADLVKQFADHINAVAVAAQASSLRLQRCFAVATAGVCLGLLACVLVWLRT